MRAFIGSTWETARDSSATARFGPERGMESIAGMDTERWDSAKLGILQREAGISLKKRLPVDVVIQVLTVPIDI